MLIERGRRHPIGGDQRADQRGDHSGGADRGRHDLERSQHARPDDGGRRFEWVFVFEGGCSGECGVV
jgi:hypothetical protein